MTDLDVVFRGTVVQAGSILKDGWIAVKDGKIAAVGSGQAPAAEKSVDHGDAMLFPGAVDAQVHSRSQANQEDFVWSTRAAAAGGVTTIVDMPYDDGSLIATAERFLRKADEAGEQARVDFALYATVHPSEGAERIDELVAAGAVGFKFSTFGTHPDRFPRIPPQRLHEYFSKIASTGLIAGVHNENDEFIRAKSHEVESSGIQDWSAHGMARPPISEALAIAEVYEIGADTGCSSHIVHCSIGRGYELAADYRARGHAATIEACIHYLILDEEHDVARLGGRAKVNPPIRPRKEVEALWAHLAAGNITVVSTDHVSWTIDRKSHPEMLKNSSGGPSLEILYPLLLKGLSERSLSLTWAARLLAANPARLFRIADRKGSFDIGCDADITVISEHDHVYDSSKSKHSIAGWSAYDGMTLRHRIDATYLRGEQVFDGTDVIAQPGTGKFVTPAGYAQGNIQ